ncbi:hypothetical protein F383_27153 [Gossypium arboreum]|uniref:Uncharacterized protein n=1 Tax=Gossypium arboreum TaxID=29729 RepID=A0A0B0PE67_GOSAR|nr:hypothetical protein F383_27153 [Gossypium arboreum]
MWSMHVPDMFYTSIQLTRMSWPRSSTILRFIIHDHFHKQAIYAISIQIHIITM